MSKRAWLKGGLAAALLFVAAVVLFESGVLVRWMATPSDWQPEPMPELEMSCSTEDAPLPWSYCVHRTPGSTSRDLLVHFHGRRGTARWWNDATYYTGELYRHWRAEGVQPPTVVSISFGPLWVLVAEHADALGPILDRATEHAATWAGHDFDRTHLVGESMGGYNALLAGLQHPNRFDRVAALCPPLSTASPFGPELFERMGESAALEAFMLLSFSRAFFADDADWRRQDPFARIDGGAAFEPALHLSCGTHDPWGCASGSTAIAHALEGRGQSPELRLLDDGHCAIDDAALADFLTR